MLIDDIISLLSADDGGTTEALLKTKVLLHQIGKKELASWVNTELNGYGERDELPSYRVLSSVVKGNVANISYMHSNHLLPVAHLKEEQRAVLQKSEMRQSLSVLSEMTSKAKGSLRRPIPIELNYSLSETLDGGYHVQQAWCEIAVHDVQGIITQVRSRLLDFLLELKDTTGASSDTELTLKASTVDTTTIFNNAVFGANTTVILNSKNVAVRTDVVVGDFRSLSDALTQAGIPADEVEKLREVIELEKKAGASPSLESGAGKWLTRLIARAAKEGWKIGTEVTAALATKALSSYLGLPP